MLRLRDIMTTELITVSPELSVRDAMQLLVTEHVSGAPVIARNRVVGVVSATDLLAFAAESASLPTDNVPEGQGIDFEADAEPAEGDEPASVWFAELESPDVADVSQRFDDLASMRPRQDRLSQYTVSDVMTHGVRALPSVTSVEEAAAFMRKAAIHRVLVMDDGTLKGIVTLKDIADAVADHKLTVHTYTFGKAPASREYRR